MKKKIKKINKNTSLIIKSICLLFTIFLLLSLFVKKANIYLDMFILQTSNTGFFDLFSINRPHVHNPIGILGAYSSYYMILYFGQLFSMLILLISVTYLILNLINIYYKRLINICCFALVSVFNLYMLEYIFFSENIYNQDKILFHYIYNFINSLIGRSGSAIFCFLSIFLSFEILTIFNPFTLLKNVYLFITQRFKVKKNKVTEFIPKIDKYIPDDEIETEIDVTSYVETEENITYLEEETFVKPQLVKNNDNVDSKSYQKPDIDLFLYKPDKEKRVDKVKLDSEIKSVSKVLKDKLAEFGIEASVLNVNVGPIITQYELEPAPGIKVNRFTSLSDDLALALKAKSIRVQAPIPGRGLIGVEVPNKNADIIFMRDIFFSDEMYNSEAILSVALGKDIAGRPIVTDLAKTPHLLIAGATGSGKSVCINTIICSILLRCTPDEVRLVMIDPKRIELSGYEGIPHLVQNVVTEPEDAMNTLTWAVYEMERRYELLQELKVRDIVGYNQKINELINKNEAEDMDKLPYIVLIVDEFADLIMTAGREIELPIARLAQMARAIGIHIILATQRPSIKVITGVIKANFPARIAFRVSSKVDSRVILDSMGADKLLGRGDMLFIPPGKSNPERIHGAYLSDSEIEGLVEYLKTQPKPKLMIQMSKPDVGNISDFEYDDDLFPAAAKVVVNTNVASVSMLQRHFKIGYARAGRLIDLLERAGVIGPHVGSKPREVLMSKEDIEGFGE